MARVTFNRQFFSQIIVLQLRIQNQSTAYIKFIFLLCVAGRNKQKSFCYVLISDESHPSYKLIYINFSVHFIVTSFRRWVLHEDKSSSNWSLSWAPSFLPMADWYPASDFTTLRKAGAIIRLDVADIRNIWKSLEKQNGHI